MKARLLRLWQGLSDAFWTLPAAIVLALGALGVFVVEIQSLGSQASWIPDGWVYGGGDTGARTLLGAIASSTISVAGTLFSITIAALTLASSQMGPRLLRNFMRDRGNQLTLGVFLGTFGYSLIVLRSVRGGEENAFVPALGVTIGLLLAGACVTLLIYFIHHVASRINVDTVIDLVHDDVLESLNTLTGDDVSPTACDPWNWDCAVDVCLEQSGYLQQIDFDSLIKWAEQHDCGIDFMKRPGAFIFPHAVIARLSRPVDGAEDAIRGSIALSRQGGSPADLTFPIAQLVEVAVRALSPGINDPQTAISVLNRLGATLNTLSRRQLDSGIYEKDGVARVQFPPLTYDGVTRVMFEMIRENAGGSPSVLVHLINVLTEAARVEHDPSRLDALRRRAGEAEAEGRAKFVNASDRQKLTETYSSFLKASGTRDA